MFTNKKYNRSSVSIILSNLALAGVVTQSLKIDNRAWVWGLMYDINHNKWSRKIEKFSLLVNLLLEIPSKNFQQTSINITLYLIEF